jgi:UDP-glucose 4-epimerase
VSERRSVVTGGCGFIGSHVVDALVGLGHHVVAVDDLSTGRRENLNPAAELAEGSILDADLLDEVMDGADWVFHVAAWPRIQRSVDDPVGTHQVNVDGTLNVLKAARDHGAERVVYSSSSSVYGDQATHLMTETMVPDPISPYALQKWMGERYGSMFARLYDMHVVSLRYFNVYGPRQPIEGAYALVIGKFLRQKGEGRPLTVYGDGEQTRAYTFVTDVARANILAAQADMPVGENRILNIGSDVETSVNEISARIGGPVEHIYPNPRGSFEERRKAADYSKARDTIGWEPEISLDDGLTRVIP